MTAPSNSYRKRNDDFEKLIIDFVKGNPSLYNGQKTEPTARLWEPFATQHNVSVKECRISWKYLRDSYVKRCKRRHTEGARPDDDTDPLSFIKDIVYNNIAKRKYLGDTGYTTMVKKKTNANTTSTKNCTKRKAIIDTTSATANMLEHRLEKKKKEETLQRYNQEIFQNEADFIDDLIPVVFCANKETLTDCADKEILTQIQDKTITFKLTTMNVSNTPEAEKPIQENIVQLPVHQLSFLQNDDLIDDTVATADKIVQIIEKRKREPNLLANKPYNHAILNQVTPSQTPINQEIITPILKNILTLKEPKINVLKKTNESTVTPKVCKSTNETPLNFNMSAMGSSHVTINNLKSNVLRTEYLNLDEENTMATYNIPNIDKSCLEEQFTETEEEVTQTSKNKSQIVESTKDSTERYFDEMGEYVSNHFPQDKQLKLKEKIWSLIMKID